MASPRTSGKRRSRKKPPKRFPGLAGAATAFGIVAAVLTLLYLLPTPPRSTPVKRPPFEEARPHPRTALPPRAALQPKELGKQKGTSVPRVAILIDDMGYDLSLDDAFMRLEAPLSFAFLPSAPYTDCLATKASKMGRDVLVHLPLEPASGDVDPGPGVLCLTMDFEHMLQILRKDLDSVPGATGVNNHMGSKFTGDRKAMELLLGEIKRRGMFFVDSRTSQKSLGYDTARSMGIPAMERTVFLDHSLEPSAISAQIHRLVEISRVKGHALAIGHPQAHTLEVLYEELPRIQKEIKVVPVRDLLVTN
jgi:polysaccharide deacetylase 2 family uncharacterized protein YibQ